VAGKRLLCSSAHRQRGPDLLRVQVYDPSHCMKSNHERRLAILVVEEVEETRDGIERLLAASGYAVITARDENEVKASLHHPDLILISSLGLDAMQVVSTARRIRERAELDEDVPVVAFCVPSLDEGTEVGAGFNVYLTRPDNFDQLRALLSRLLGKLRRPD
jgi:CheY-like chemotaxis protein